MSYTCLGYVDKAYDMCVFVFNPCARLVFVGQQASGNQGSFGEEESFGTWLVLWFAYHSGILAARVLLQYMKMRQANKSQSDRQRGG